MTGSTITASPNAPRRTLSQRRGSLSASDPYALNAEVDNARGAASRITIVRVPQTANTNAEQQGRSHRDHARRSSWGSQHSASSSGSGGRGPGRLSFAFSTFTPIKNDGPPSPGRGGGPGGPQQGPPSPRMYSRSGSFSSSGHGRPMSVQLTPQQICDLAVDAIHPKTPATPAMQETTPATFMPLPDEQYLPFLDRPVEVSALLNSPPTSRLMALLSQTFPADRRDPYDPEAPASTYGEDPSLWSFPELSRWLLTTPRTEADDREWVAKARTCILARSELIWSRLKAALGVPPELEEDEEEDEEDLVPVSLESSGVLEESGGVNVIPTDEPEQEAWLEPIMPGDNMTCVASPISAPGESFGGMESIGEGAEEPEDPNAPTPGGNDPAIVPSAIQGLRISTPMIEIGGTTRSVSPLVTPLGTSLPSGSSHSPSFATESLSPPSALGLRRAMSSGSSTSSTEERRRASLVMAGPGRVRRSAQQERGTGDALFPSSFAALTMGPSLVANNPALRSGPRRSFRPGVSFAGVRGLHGGSVDTDGNDYAISIGTGSERSFVLR